MKKRESIVVLALPRWDGRYSSTSYSLAQELSKEHQVFYIDNPFTIKDVFTRFFKKQITRRFQALFFGWNKFLKASGELDLTYVTPRMVLPVNFLPAGKWYDFFSKVNDRIVYRSVRSLIKKYELKDFIFINSYNPFYSLSFPGSFNPKVKIYHCVDDISESNYVAKHGVRQEQRLMKAFDITLATSKELCRLKEPYAGTVHYLPNAADFEHFKKLIGVERPDLFGKELNNRKVIGYIGNICHRLDYDLLSRVIEHHKDKMFLFVGPISNPGVKDWGLDKRDNTLFVGSKPMEELPFYLNRMDCTMIPFKCNALTRSIYPLKINEYLSMGKPVVSTAFSEDIAQFEEMISIANEADSFSKMVDEELINDSDELRQKRIAMASENTWEKRAARFLEIVEGFSLVKV